MSESLGRQFRLTISAHALRSVEHRGGLDEFLLKAKDSELSLKARRIKRNLESRTSADEPAKATA